MPSPKTHIFAADSLLTSYQVGALLQVNPSSINKWIKDGRLPAFRTPGGHRRIRAADVMTFLLAHKMPVPPGLLAATQHILALGDDPQLFARLAAAMGEQLPHCQLTRTADGVEGLLQAQAYLPALVLLGPSMPPLATLDVCRRLAAMASTRQVPRVVLLDPRAADGERRARESGATLVLRLPLDPAPVLALLGAATANAHAS